jgi:hypothetical protein
VAAQLVICQVLLSSTELVSKLINCRSCSLSVSLPFLSVQVQRGPFKTQDKMVIYPSIRKISYWQDKYPFK